MQDRYGVIVTTINDPTQAVTMLRDGCNRLDATFYVIGDTKSPSDFHLDDAQYYDVAAQLETDLSFAKLCPVRHYARKNIGYLLAARDGVTVLIETDDDNLPRDAFWQPRQRRQTGRLDQNTGWSNVYSYFANSTIWPRGLPLNEIQRARVPYLDLPETTLDCPIQQGLADANPDVDAIYRLAFPLPYDFAPDRKVILGRDVWCPFNSQNTTFWRETFPLLYLPYHCSFRMTDIWRSFVAQRIMWENDWHLQFHSATVLQERNEHDLMRDFADEVPGYLHNETIRHALTELPIAAGVEAIPDNMRLAYGRLVDLEMIGQAELPLLDAFLDDLSRCG